MVGEGVRGGGVQERIQGRGAARRRRPDGPPVQRDPVGPPVDAGLVVRLRRDRSEDRRDPQGAGDARLVACPAGRPDRHRVIDRRAAPRSLRRRVGPGAEHLAALDPTAEPAAMVLARIRQLSAHEVGHTLGLAHNFAASACGRASVMDYPAPREDPRRQDARPLRRLRQGARGVRLAGHPLRLCAVPRRGRRGEEASGDRPPGRRRWPAVPVRRRRPAGRRGPPAGQSLGQRRRPRRLAPSRDEGAGDRPRAVRPRPALPTGRRSPTSKPGSCPYTCTTATSSRRP